MFIKFSPDMKVEINANHLLLVIIQYLKVFSSHRSYSNCYCFMLLSLCNSEQLLLYQLSVDTSLIHCFFHNFRSSLTLIRITSPCGKPWRSWLMLESAKPLVCPTLTPASWKRCVTIIWIKINILCSTRHFFKIHFQITASARIPIAANQIECNAYFQQRNVRKTMDKLGIRCMAYAPLGSPGKDWMKINSY